VDFHSVPRDGEFGNETWKDGSWKTTGAANVWTMMSADEALGKLVGEVTLPRNATGAPMSYMLTASNTS
jgi:quinoprotein glucose dehydrogenase